MSGRIIFVRLLSSKKQQNFSMVGCDLGVDKAHEVKSEAIGGCNNEGQTHMP